MTDDQLAKILARWHFSEGGVCSSVSREALMAHLMRAVPECDGARVFRSFIDDGWLQLNECGDGYILGPVLAERYREFQKRGLIDGSLRAESGLSVEAQWVHFRKLLDYYIDCMRHNARRQEALFCSDYRKKFFMPLLNAVGRGWLKPLSAQTRTLEVEVPYSYEEKAAINIMRGAVTDSGGDIYIGYPVEQFLDKNGDAHYSPICLLPTEILPAVGDKIRLRIHLDDADINFSWLEKGVRQESRQALVNALQSLPRGDEFQGCIDVYEALALIEAQCRDSEVKLVPAAIEQAPTGLPKGKKRMLRNSAVLFAGEDGVYTRNLMRELRQIRDEASAEDLEQTALAYIFREVPLKVKAPEELSMPLPFIEMNSEQQQAVSDALNKPVSRITGPPGTGKSQVAVNIICNVLYRQKSVLFTSMNNKAVHAIEERITQVEKEISAVLPHQLRLALVNFAGGNSGLSWDKVLIDSIAAELSNMQAFEGENNHLAVEQELEYWRTLEERVSAREELKERSAKIEQALQEQSQQVATMQIAELSAPADEKDHRYLNKIFSELGEERPFEWSWRWLKWRLWERAGQRRAREYVMTHYPRYCQRFVSITKLREALLRYLASTAKLRGYQQQAENLTQQAKALTDDDQETIAELGECMTRLKANMHGALGNAIVSNGCDFAREPRAMTRLKGAITTLSTAGCAFAASRSMEAIQEAKQVIPNLTRLLPGWASTMLSIQHAAPLVAGYFDRVVIDEASTCLIPPMIPALFRAKALTVIGDPQQFPPVRSIAPFRHSYIAMRAHFDSVKDGAFDFMNNTAYSVMNYLPVLLREHFRCAEEIAQYCNDQFYQSQLIVRSNEESLRARRPGTYRNAVQWHECATRDAEIATVCKCINELQQNDYPGTIGVLTVLRDDARTIEERLNPAFRHFGTERLMVSTAHGFQGGECDVIFLVLGYHANIAHGNKWYFEERSHRYIYNVAVSRAKACLVIIGDREYCRDCAVPELRALAQLPRLETGTRKALFDSIWEERFYNALLQAGIKTEPQYRIVGRRLDLAVITDGVKIDIEVDGVKYHRGATGGRKLDDEFRDWQIMSCGWKVMRFWVYELREDMNACIEKVRTELAQATPSAEP